MRKSTPITNISEINIRIAEIKELAGNKTLLSVPTIFLAICGPIRPRKKKFPPKATEAEEMATAQKAMIMNSFFTFTPIPLAISYPYLWHLKFWIYSR